MSRKNTTQLLQSRFAKNGCASVTLTTFEPDAAGNTHFWTLWFDGEPSCPTSEIRRDTDAILSLNGYKHGNVVRIRFTDIYA